MIRIHTASCACASQSRLASLDGGLWTAAAAAAPSCDLQKGPVRPVQRKKQTVQIELAVAISISISPFLFVFPAASYSQPITNH